MTDERFNDGADVDDILVCSWGYDQTNVDFYKVTRRTKASAWIVKIGSKIVPGSEGYMSESVVPDPENVLGHAFVPTGDMDSCERCWRTFREHGPKLHRVRHSFQGERAVLTMTSYSVAVPWDGAPKYASHYA